MSEFNIEIFTPEKLFFEGKVEAVICPTINGDIEILKGHQNLVAALTQDEIKLKINGEWITAVVSDGFFEVRPDKVLVFAKYCDKAEDYLEAKAEREKAILAEQEQYQNNLTKQKITNISLSKYIISGRKSKRSLNI